jgi:hypothetical protein
MRVQQSSGADGRLPGNSHRQKRAHIGIFPVFGGDMSLVAQEVNVDVGVT